MLHKEPNVKGFDLVRGKHQACVDASLLKYPLTLRRWQQGDRFYPFGMKGQKLVSDYLTDRKYSLFEKEAQWILCDADKQIVWLVGERSDERFRVKAATHEILVLSWE